MGMEGMPDTKQESPDMEKYRVKAEQLDGEIKELQRQIKNSQYSIDKIGTPDNTNTENTVNSSRRFISEAQEQIARLEMERQDVLKRIR